MNRPVPSRLRALLIEIAAKHNVRLPDEGVGHVAGSDRQLLMDALLQELLETGLGPGDEPNERGFDIEEIIDVVGNIAGKNDAFRS